MKTVIEQGLSKLFEAWAGKPVSRIVALPPSGSDRRYFRLYGTQKTAIGAFHKNDAENKAFLTFTKHFFAKNLPVPEVYGEDLDNHIYLLEDLGDHSLFLHLTEERTGKPFPIDMYQRALDELPKFQVLGHEGLDYSVCYPTDIFDKQAMLWDLNYFKYYFARFAKLDFDEHDLEKDFHTLTDYLASADSNFFMYRDFQARNIMLVEGQPYFIDYQGGRRGPLQYDLVSLLYQAKANIDQEVREELLEYYLRQLKQYIAVDEATFKDYFYGFLLIRSLQVLGAYGFRGFHERREHFLTSIPYAINNIEWLLQKVHFPFKMPMLEAMLQQLIANDSLRQFGPCEEDNHFLTVTVNSFSYKQGLPKDTSGHGGGFVFDCRAINNPGKFEPYKNLTGRDSAVIQFLKRESKVDEFLRSVYALVDASIERYLSRKFTHLSVSFGCTGGQHRSVYCADALAKHLEYKYNVTVKLNHIEQERKGWRN